MKKFSIFIFSLLLIGTVVLTNCKKDEETKDPTSFEITLNDNLGNPVSNATVKLYKTQSDWQNGTNQVGTNQISNTSGKVSFTNLDAIIYYWFAEKDCISNYNGSIRVTTALTANVKNTVTTVLAGTGTISFVNNSSNPYKVYINGTEYFTMNGGTSRNITYLPVASYTIRVLQVSGYVFYPTDETYNGNVTCGGTSTVSFP